MLINEGVILISYYMMLEWMGASGHKSLTAQ